MEVGHGQEKSEEGKKVPEEEESSGSKGGCEVRKEDGRKEEGGGQESPRAQEGGRQETSATRDAHGGAPGARYRYGCGGTFHGGDAGREDCPEPGGRLAVSDGLQALMGSE
jgi:hypothetical protein